MRALVSKHLKRLKTTFLSLNNTFYIYFFILLILLFAKNNIYLILPLIFIIYLFKNYINMKILMVFFITFLILISIYYILTNNLINFNYYFVVEKKKNYIIVSNLFSKYIFYNTDYEVFDILNIKNFKFKNQIEFINMNINLKDYIINKNIYGLLYKVKDVNKIFSFNFLYIKKYIEVYFSYFPNNTKNYLNIIFLNNDVNGIKNLYSIYGLSYLIGLSGFHIYFIINILKKVMYYININSNIQFYIILSFLIFFTVNFYSFTILRILILFLLYYINKEYELNYNKISLLTLCYFILLIIPNIYNQLPYQISFVVLFFYYLGIENRKLKSRFKITIYNNIILLLCILPFFINMYNGLNLFVILFSLILSNILKKATIPLIYISLVFYPFSYINEYVLISFETILEKFSNYNVFFKIGKINTYYSFLYYILLIYLLADYKSIKRYLFLLYIAINLYLIININISDKLYIFNEEYHNSIYIEEKENNNTISINPDINQLKYLSLNNKKIDYLFISKEYINEEIRKILINNYQIKEIYSNSNFINKKYFSIKKEYVINKIKLKFYISNQIFLSNNIDYELILNNKNYFISDKFDNKNYKNYKEEYLKYYDYLIIKNYNKKSYSYHNYYNKIINLNNLDYVYLIYSFNNMNFIYNFKYNIYLL